MSHPDAFLATKGRLQLARCVVDDGWPLRRAAERFQVSVPTAARWAGRYREHGANGMEDRPQRPSALPLSRSGSMTTIITEATPHSRVSHQQAASLTSVVNTLRERSVTGPRGRPKHPRPTRWASLIR